MPPATPPGADAGHGGSRGRDSFTIAVTTDGAPPTSGGLGLAVRVRWPSGPPVDPTPGVVNGGSGNLPLSWGSRPRTGRQSRTPRRTAWSGGSSCAGARRGLPATWEVQARAGHARASSDTFQINLKTTSLGMKKGTIYVVEVRVLVNGSEPEAGGVRLGRRASSTSVGDDAAGQGRGSSDYAASCGGGAWRCSLARAGP